MRRVMLGPPGKLLKQIAVLNAFFVLIVGSRANSCSLPLLRLPRLVDKKISLPAAPPAPVWDPHYIQILGLRNFKISAEVREQLDEGAPRYLNYIEDLGHDAESIGTALLQNIERGLDVPRVLHYRLNQACRNLSKASFSKYLERRCAAVIQQTRRVFGFSWVLEAAKLNQSQHQSAELYLFPKPGEAGHIPGLPFEDSAQLMKAIKALAQSDDHQMAVETNRANWESSGDRLREVFSADAFQRVETQTRKLRSLLDKIESALLDSEIAIRDSGGLEAFLRSQNIDLLAFQRSLEIMAASDEGTANFGAAIGALAAIQSLFPAHPLATRISASLDAETKRLVERTTESPL